MSAQGIALVVLHKWLAWIYAARVVTLRPKGATTCEPRASPWVCEAQYQEALKGRNNQRHAPFIKRKVPQVG